MSGASAEPAASSSAGSVATGMWDVLCPPAPPKSPVGAVSVGIRLLLVPVGELCKPWARGGSRAAPTEQWAGAMVGVVVVLVVVGAVGLVAAVVLLVLVLVVSMVMLARLVLEVGSAVGVVSVVVMVVLGLLVSMVELVLVVLVVLLLLVLLTSPLLAVLVSLGGTLS